MTDGTTTTHTESPLAALLTGWAAEMRAAFAAMDSGVTSTGTAVQPMVRIMQPMVRSKSYRVQQRQRMRRGRRMMRNMRRMHGGDLHGMPYLQMMARWLDHTDNMERRQQRAQGTNWRGRKP